MRLFTFGVRNGAHEVVVPHFVAAEKDAQSVSASATGRTLFIFSLVSTVRGSLQAARAVPKRKCLPHITPHLQPEPYSLSLERILNTQHSAPAKQIRRRHKRRWRGALALRECLAPSDLG